MVKFVLREGVDGVCFVLEGGPGANVNQFHLIAASAIRRARVVVLIRHFNLELSLLDLLVVPKLFSEEIQVFKQSHLRFISWLVSICYI